MSDLGKLYIPNTKSDVLKCIEQSQQAESPSTYDCIILDDAAIVHSLSTSGAKTFIVYADDAFIPYLSKQLCVATRLYVVWDTYIPDSLKGFTHDKRGKGVHRKVSGLTKLPSNWMDFLCDAQNKQELFSFRTSRVIEFAFCLPTKQEHTYHFRCFCVVSIGESNSQMSIHNHEEADTRIVVHILHALEQGMKIIKVRTGDTDVVTILVGVYFNVAMIQPQVDTYLGCLWYGQKFPLYNQCFSLNRELYQYSML